MSGFALGALPEVLIKPLHIRIFESHASLDTRPPLRDTDVIVRNHLRLLSLRQTGLKSEIHRRRSYINETALGWDGRVGCSRLLLLCRYRMLPANSQCSGSMPACGAGQFLRQEGKRNGIANGNRWQR